MKERPILFSGPMVRAILEGRKTQTRRLVRGVEAMADTYDGPAFTETGWRWKFGAAHPFTYVACPYGQAGDRLWVRETWTIVPRTAYAHSEGVQQTLRPNDNHDAAIYKAEWTRSSPGGWRSPRFMPRWASRLTLEVVGVRVERLQDISEDDAIAEGMQALPGVLSRPLGSKGPHLPHTARDAFKGLWDDINGKRAPWSSNPWVWVVEFRRLP